MAINIDTSKPLTDEQIEELRARLPENLVQRYVELAKGGEKAPETGNQGGEGEKPKPARPKGGKGESDLLS